jgi:hypothetical protein
MARTRKAPERIQKKGTTTQKGTATKKKHAPPKATKHSIRRILAERQSSRKGNRAEKEYLIDWFPSWERKSILPDQAQEIEDWEANKSEDHTFKFDGAEVYHCTNPTENDHEVNLRTMADNVLLHFKRWMTRNPDTVAKEIFDDRDWAFASQDEADAAAELVFGDEAVPVTAGEVMRRTYVAMRGLNKTIFESEDVDYGTIKVKYLGQVDSSFRRAESSRRNQEAEPIGFLEPLFAVDLRSVKPENWETPEQLHDNMAPLKDMARRFTYTSPFMLNHPWPMMFTRLFRTSDQIACLLGKGHGIGVSDGWQERTRDFFLYTYMKEVDDMRPVDCVERTYLACRDSCMWHAKFRSEADEEDGELSDME